MQNLPVFPDAVFKDDNPLKTVERIKNILRENHIEVTEHWSESNVPHCLSLAICVNGTTFSVNGKGVTREFALASGYGELMERMQLGYTYKNDQQKNGNVSADTLRSERVPVEQLLQRNPSWYESMVAGLERSTGRKMTEREMLMQFANEDGTIDVTPFYNLVTRTKEYMPTELRKVLYSTNGCAAGNTMEEAIVQAISEIVERYFKMRILSEQIALPLIPDEVLQTCKIAYSIITFLRENGLRVSVLDCSLGTKFPVVCVCLVDSRNGKYHTHFGAYPNFEIALQRTLTETFQGRKLESVAKYEDFCLDKDDVYRLRYLMNELVRGTSEKTPEFFLNTVQGPYRQTAGFTGGNNRQLLQECIEFFREQGVDILVRDSSCLGFPTYQVIIPGRSEVFAHRISKLDDDMRYRDYARRALRDPATATPADLLGLLKHLNQTSLNALSGPHRFGAEAGLPVELDGKLDGYLLYAALAHVNYTLGRYADTAKHIDGMISTCAGEQIEYLLCIKRYLSLKQNKYEPEKIRQILEYFHEAQSVEKLYNCLENRKNPLNDMVLHCDKQCRADCRLRAHCTREKTMQLNQMINAKTAQLKFEDLVARMDAALDA